MPSAAHQALADALLALQQLAERDATIAEQAARIAQLELAAQLAECDATIAEQATRASGLAVVAVVAVVAGPLSTFRVLWSEYGFRART